MQVGRTRLTVEEWNRRRTDGVCLYCGSTVALGALLSANCRPQSLNFTLPVYLNSPGLEPVSTSTPTQWSTQLAWVEYAINSLRSAATGRSPFEVSLGYQPPLFPEEEVDLPVPSVQAHIRRCRRAWGIARNGLQKAQSSAKRYANRRRRPGPGRTEGLAFSR
ncbi:hypothetical protein AOLI_G00221700 [Acnodon oligacanthus]